jgi:hypothetical protein
MDFREVRYEDGMWKDLGWLLAVLNLWVLLL